MATPSSTLAWRIPYGQRSLAGYSPWGCKESDMIEQLSSFSFKYRENFHNDFSLHIDLIYFNVTCK